MMKVEEFNKMDEKINQRNFYDSYKSINIISTVLSYFGHLVSIFLAFFFMSKVISSGIPENPIVSGIIAVVVLIGLELLKRYIFDEFSIQSIKNKGIKKSTIALLVTSLLLISASFYSSINGAMEFSSRTEEMDVVADVNIKKYKDSVYEAYSSKITNLEEQNKDLFESNKLLDEEARELPSTWVTNKNKIRSRIDKNNEQIDKNDYKISNIKKERDSDIKDYKNKVISKTKDKKSENSHNSLIFIITSTIIEFIILGGVYFNEYFRYRSHREFREKVEKDPNYQKWYLYDKMLNIVIKEDSKLNEKLPSNKAIVDLCKIHDITVLPKDMKDFLKILNDLKIIKTSGSAKYITMSKDLAKDKLKSNFNIT